MKAIIYTKYGSPDVLELKDIDKPTPKDNEVLVKVFAASVNPLDWHFMEAKPFLARTESGLFKPKNNKLGADFAGRIEQVGTNVKEFKVGDEVFGDISLSSLGSLAEYACVPEELIVLKPKNLTFEQAASVPVASFTALQGLRDKGQIKKGQKVLINGASGGVGSFAVQIAKSFETEVTGVCSTKNLDMVKSIGADYVIDYTKEDFTNTDKKYDLVFDAVGNRSRSDLGRALTPDGIASVAGFKSMARLFSIMIFGGKKVGMMKTAHPNKEDLMFIKSLIESGKVKPLIDRTYSLEQVPEAIRYLEEGHAKGKVVIKTAKD